MNLVLLPTRSSALRHLIREDLPVPDIMVIDNSTSIEVVVPGETLANQIQEQFGWNRGYPVGGATRFTPDLGLSKVLDLLRPLWDTIPK